MNVCENVRQEVPQVPVETMHYEDMTMNLNLQEF